MLLLLACAGGPPPPLPAGPLPEARLAQGSEAVAWRALDELAGATFQFPASNAPEAFEGTFRLTGPWRDAMRRVGRMRAYTTPLPFPCDMPRPNYAPLGARLYLGGEEVPYAGGLKQSAGASWYVEAGQIHLLTIESPEAAAPELRVPEIAATLRARNHADAGVPDAVFAQVEATVGPVTRPALYVPAPGAISFQLDVPPGAHLDLGAALLPDPLRGADAGDGAVASIEVGGAEVWSESLSPGGSFEDATIPLPAGPTTLTFRSGSAGSSDYDYVVFSAPTIVANAKRPPRQVLVVGIDTLRWDALGLNGRERATSPELDAWAGDAVAFDDARAPAPRTRPSFRTALTGRYPGAARATRQTAAVLRAHGFRTAGFAANVHLVPRFGFNEGFEHWHYENGAKAGDQVDRALAWIAAHEREDWYVFVHLMDPHTWYNAPLPFGVRFTGGRHPKSLPDPFDRWQVDAAMRRKTLTDADKELVRGAYDGEVAYTSHALERLLRQRDGGRRLTVIHSDHGEEFWDHGGFEHNHSLYDELVKALLVVRPPDGWGGGPHRVAAPVGLQDIAPTLLDLLEIPVADRPPTDGISLRPFLDSARPDDGLATVLAERALYQGHLMFDTERWSTTHRGHKYILHTGSGREELYDLRADPREQAPLPSDHGLLPELRSALSRATGWPVGPGWRLTVRVSGPGAWGIRFDAPIAAAGVIDPEALREVRANLEWGERPTITVAEVGRVSLSADHTQLLFEPGPKADDQVLYIRCEAACPAGVFQGVGAEVALAPGDHEVAGTKLRATPGTVIEPAGNDADALATPTDSLQLEALKLLGYLDGDHGGAPPH